MDDEAIIKEFFARYFIAGRKKIGSNELEYFVADNRLPAGKFALGPFRNSEAAQIARMKILIQRFRDHDAGAGHG